jgi:ABC-type sugar transport system ATPase subunit
VQEQEQKQMSLRDVDGVSSVLGDRDGRRLLSMDNITKDFPGGRVLHDVNFRLDIGEIHALIGQNGAGKSTLMKILAGNYPDHGGEILLSGKPIKIRSPRDAIDQGIAIIYQEFALAADLTVAENIALGREPTRWGKYLVDHRGLCRRSHDEARALGIDLPMNVPLGRLSVAQQQLTEIVKAVARNARVLVMDEPTARLSSAERTQLFSIIKRLSNKGVGIIYISHFLEEIFAVASRVTVLRDGYGVASLPLSQLDTGALARMMVGDKFRELDLTKRHREAAVKGTAALTVTDFCVPGKLKPTSFTLHKGEIIGLAGLQGAGRTELASALVGNGAPDRSGHIEMKGFSGLFRNPEHALSHGCLMLPANRKSEGILALRDLSENIVISTLRNDLGRFGFVKRAARRALVDSMIARFRVHPPNPRRLISSLSGGNQQKVLFARSAASRANVLILDQPTAGVDVGATVEIYDQIDVLTKSGIAGIVISDDLNELLRLSDRIFLFKEGGVIDKQPSTAFTRPSLLACIVGGLTLDEFNLKTTGSGQAD